MPSWRPTLTDNHFNGFIPRTFVWQPSLLELYMISAKSSTQLLLQTVCSVLIILKHFRWNNPERWHFCQHSFHTLSKCASLLQKCSILKYPSHKIRTAVVSKVVVDVFWSIQTTSSPTLVENVFQRMKNILRWCYVFSDKSLDLFTRCSRNHLFYAA